MCKDNGNGSGKGRNIPMEQERARIFDFKNPTRRRVKICLFWTHNYDTLAGPYIDRARTVLQRHNLQLDDHLAAQLPFNQMIGQSASEDEDVETLRNQCHQAHVHDGRIPVILAKYWQTATWAGKTYTQATHPNWLPFVIINLDKPVSDNATMIHELCHAAGNPNDWPKKDGDDYSRYRPVMINHLDDRNCMHRGDVVRMAAAYFAGPV